MSAADVQLNRLDEGREFLPEPVVWSDNLAAIEQATPQLAHALRDAPLPPHWRSARGLCGAPTYRIEPPGTPAAWLSGTAVPSVRAEAFLVAAPTDQNLALPTIAAGAELSLLLARLAPWQAVFVMEPDLAQLAAVLRIVPLAEAIAGRRCLISPPGDEQRHLLALLGHAHGLLPPRRILKMPGATAERIEALRQVCEAVAAQVSQERAARLKALVAHRRPARSGQVRLAILATHDDPRAHGAARHLARAASVLAWAVEPCIADGPAAVDPLAHAEALARFEPSVVLAVDGHDEAWSAIRASTSDAAENGAHRAAWWLSPRPNAWRAPGGRDVLHLAATPRVLAEMRAAGLSDHDLLAWYWAARDEAAPCPDQPFDAARVVLVADSPDDAPATCGIDQPTHKQLWAAIRELAADAWRGGRPWTPLQLMTQAEARSGVRIEAPPRGNWLRLVENVATPAARAAGALRVLQAEGCRVVACGAGWKAAPGLSVASERDLLSPGAAAPLAFVFIPGCDPLHPLLPEAAARGWPIAMLRTASIVEGLGGVLQTEHVTWFGDAAGLRDVLRGLRDADARRRVASRAADHVRRGHTWGARLRSLAERIEARAAAAPGRS